MEAKFDYRNTHESDYKELCEWWTWHKFAAPIRIILPDDLSSGIMVSLNGENICAGFIYRTSSSSLFHCEWIVSTFKVKDKEIRKSALVFLITGLKHMALQMGAKVIYSSLINQSLIQKFMDCGYVKGNSGSQEMVFVL